jgi:thiol-disulfide isomerase/thioredoxin
MKRIILFLLCIPFIASAQKESAVNISVKVDSSKMRELRIYRYGINDHLQNAELDTIIRIAPYKKQNFSLKISREGMYGIQDGMWSMFTHDVFLKPGDTLTLLFMLRPDFEEQLKKKDAVFTEHAMTVKAKFPGNITLFDDIANKRPVKYGRIPNETVLAYKARCDSVYSLWTDILNRYIQERKVSRDFIPYARAELYASYLKWLVDPCNIAPHLQLPSGYFSGVDTLNFNNTQYMQSLKDYGQAALIYNHYVLNSFNLYNRRANLKDEFNSIQKNYTGIVKDELMAVKIKDYLGQTDPYFDTAYSIFLKQCQNENIKKFIQDKVLAYHYNKKTPSYGKVNLAEVLSGTMLYSEDNQLVPINKVIATDKPCLIDCWASWCGPCREQMPYLRAIEKKFKDSVQFISLSFDKERRLWNNFLVKNKDALSSPQYRLYFTSNPIFVKYFKVQTIPRYILLSKGGDRILESSMPKPMFTDQFIETLRENLK